MNSLCPRRDEGGRSSRHSRIHLGMDNFEARGRERVRVDCANLVMWLPLDPRGRAWLTLFAGLRRKHSFCQSATDSSVNPVAHSSRPAALTRRRRPATSTLASLTDRTCAGSVMMNIQTPCIVQAMTKVAGCFFILSIRLSCPSLCIL